MAPRTPTPAYVLALVSLPVFIGALDLTIVSAVLPNVVVDLHIPFQTGADDAAWVVSGYLLAYTVSVAVMGRVSDLIGRRRTYFLSLLLFILGSWLVATATVQPANLMYRLFRLLQGGRPDRAYMALYALIAGRVVQALGAGAMVPVTMALVGDLYPPGRRSMPLGIVGAVDTAGWVLGHLYGGVMVQFVHWSVLFWLNIPITTVVAMLTWHNLDTIAEDHQEGSLGSIATGVIGSAMVIVNVLAAGAIIMAIWPSATEIQALIGGAWPSAICALSLLGAFAFTLTRAQPKPGTGQADWLGTALITLSLIGLNLGLGINSEGAGAIGTIEEMSSLSPYALPLLGVSGVLFGLFIWVETRVQSPLFRLTNFRDRNVAFSTFTNLLVGFCLMVGLVSVPLFINTLVAETLDEAALVSGILLGALTIPMALASVPGGLLTERLGYRVTTMLGLAIAAVGFYLGRTWTPEITQAMIASHLALAGIGLGLTIAPIGTAVINAVHADERGVASALVLIMRLIGMTMGTSAMTTYGLRRSTTLSRMLIAELQTLDSAQLYAITIQVITRVINEMFIIAMIVCLVALLPAACLRAGDRIRQTPS